MRDFLITNNQIKSKAQSSKTDVLVIDYWLLVIEIFT
jgi:hypothetical protein